MTRSLGKLGLVLACAVATVSAGLLVQAQDGAQPGAGAAAKAIAKKKHRASQRRPFKPGARFVCTIVSNEAGGFKKADYVAGVDPVTCVYTDDDGVGDPKPWTFVSGKRHPTNPRKLTLVFTAYDIDPTAASARAGGTEEAKTGGASKTATSSAFVSSSGSITITVDDGGDPSTTDPGFGFDVEPVDIDPCL
jgi:hypothetical protein